MWYIVKKKEEEGKRGDGECVLVNVAFCCRHHDYEKRQLKIGSAYVDSWNVGRVGSRDDLVDFDFMI